MKFLRKFEIDIIRLKEGSHEFPFDVGNEFLQHFEGNDIASNGRLKATVTLNKRAALIEALFDIKGTVELICDRSLEQFDHLLEIHQRVLYKYGPEEQEINEEIYVITQDTASINVAQLIYEFIVLAIPAKKIHPDYMDEEDDEVDAEGKLVYVSEADEEDEEREEESENPLWEELKKLKGNN
ncbi:YceD family protein [Pleomorphovibrio marinus]|uniref:YceD family protein n=1 Tax=Pleomorphovibrio marinus TaxID=2164132 RepID=UPI000E0A9D31|nr:DUF177 domain-containing protein [Pleomorphovibrio marinus]